MDVFLERIQTNPRAVKIRSAPFPCRTVYQRFPLFFQRVDLAQFQKEVRYSSPDLLARDIEYGTQIFDDRLLGGFFTKALQDECPEFLATDDITQGRGGKGFLFQFHNCNPGFRAAKASFLKVDYIQSSSVARTDRRKAQGQATSQSFN